MSVTSVISLCGFIVVVLGGAVAVGKLMQMLTQTIARVDKLESGAAGGADHAARLLQVEKNTAKLDGLADRMTKLETSTEIHHTDVTATLARLDRGQQQTNRMIGNFIAQASGGKLMIVSPSDSEG